MKKIFLLSMLVIILVSCSSENDNIPDDTSGNIQGTWQLKAEYIGGVRESLSECRLNENMSFDGTAVIVVKSDETGNVNCNLSTQEGTFIRTGTNLSIAFTNENLKSKIKELTTVKLVLIPENSDKTFEYERAK